MFFAWTIFNALFSVSSPLTFDGVEGQMNKGALGCQFFCHWSWDVWTCTCKNHISYRVIKVIGTKYFNQVMGIGIYYYCCCCLWYLIGIFHLLGILFNFVCLTPPAMTCTKKIRDDKSSFLCPTKWWYGISHFLDFYVSKITHHCVCSFVALFIGVVVVTVMHYNYTIWQNTKKCSILNDYLSKATYVYLTSLRSCRACRKRG